MRSPRLLAVAVATAVLGLAACGTSSPSTAPEPGAEPAQADQGGYPVSVEHALGTTVLEAQPERVATVNWANHEVPLALGVVPVGMAAANFGDDNGDGVLPWVEERLTELGAETPVLFDETDGIDFEAVADTQPDVILAGYSGLTQADYDTLSEIAPVVAYPQAPWATTWRETIEINSAGMGMAEEGEQLLADLEAEIDAVATEHPQLAGKRTMFLTHLDPNDLSEVNFYSAKDTRAAFFEDLGMATPPSIAAISEQSDSFSGSVSAEQIDQFADVDIIVTYADGLVAEDLRADPLLAQMPAIANDAIVALPNTDPLGTAANPTPLAISWVLEDYADLLAEAADKAQ